MADDDKLRDGGEEVYEDVDGETEYRPRTLSETKIWFNIVGKSRDVSPCHGREKHNVSFDTATVTKETTMKRVHYPRFELSTQIFRYSENNQVFCTFVEGSSARQHLDGDEDDHYSIVPVSRPQRFGERPLAG